MQWNKPTYLTTIPHTSSPKNAQRRKQVIIFDQTQTKNAKTIQIDKRPIDLGREYPHEIQISYK